MFVITILKNDLRELKGKDIVDNATQVLNATTIAPGMYKPDPVILAPKVKNNREAHKYYLKHTMKQAAIFREVVEQAKSRNPLDSTSYLACMYVKLIQELLGVNPSTSASGSKPLGNTKNDRISRTPSSNEKNKVEVQSRKDKSSLNKRNSIEMSVMNMLSILLKVPRLFVLMNMRAKSASKKNKKRKEWKPTGKVFNSVGYKLKPTGKTFTLVGNACPLTRLTATNKVPLRVPIPLKVVAPKHVVTRVYTKRPKVPKSVQNSKPKVVIQIVLWYLDSECSKHMTEDHSQLTNFVHKFLGIVKFSNYQVAKIMEYDLEVAFRKHTCFVHNLEGVDLLLGSRGTNMYSLFIGDMMASYSICLLSKATKTKSWLWHRRLSHLNVGAINHMARHGLVRGLLRLKFEKDHLCSACAMGKRKKQSHKSKSKDTNQEKLYLLHMDLCGPIRVASVNRKKLNATVRNIRTDNGTEFVNQTLREYYEQLLHDRKPDLSYLHVFGALCYPNNDSENLGKLQAKVDIGIFIGYAPKKKAYRIYNRRTRKIIETIHVDFDELTAMASEQSSLEPVLHEMTSTTPSSGLIPNPPPSAPFVPPSRHEWDFVFQPVFEEFFSPPASVASPVPIEEAPAPVESTEESHDLEVAHMSNDPYFGIPIPETISEESSSSDVIPTTVHSDASISEHLTMQEELNKFERLKVWELVPRLNKVMLITLKWIYKVKLDELGGILKNNARLVARGYRQEEGIDF
ncbi:retrovirus-related pol polyprotein from transposon TNT 1-94 [Tanacetum coccineum]